MARKVLQRLQLMKAKYEEWVSTGVPEGVDFKTSLSSARGWSCPEHGIFAIGSNRDWNTEHKKYGTLVAEIGELMSKLRSVRDVELLENLEESPDQKPRTYTTQLARRLVAEAKLDEAYERLIAVTANYHQAKYELEVKVQEYQTLSVRTRDLTQDFERVSNENSQIKRLLADQTRGLKVIE